MSETTVINTVKLSGSKSGQIKVAHIEKPYGEFSNPVVSIGVSLHKNQNEPEWKVHIPYNNLDDLMLAIQSAKEYYRELDTDHHLHAELSAETGGGA